MRSLHTALAVVALASACTRHLDVVNPKDIAGRAVTIDTGRGSTETGTVSSDGSWLRTSHGDVDVGDVNTITVTRRWRGALEGGAIGLLLAGATGAVIGYSQGDDRCTTFCILQFSAADKAGLVGSAFGGVGAVIGMIVGAIHGGHDVYDIGGTEGLPRITPTGPPGSVAGMTVQF